MFICLYVHCYYTNVHGYLFIHFAVVAWVTYNYAYNYAFNYVYNYAFNYVCNYVHDCI